MKKSPLPLQSVSGKGPKEKTVVGKESLVKLLRWHFGHNNFRGKQLDAIQAVLSGRDCFCLMPTGGGKSLCYQIPSLAKPGIVLVVSPLIALMENQVMVLKEKRIAAEFLSSTQTTAVRNKIHEDLNSGKPSIRLLYVTPELIATPGFMSKLTKIHSRGLLNLIAIDEAHCISTWGHDFRPSYRQLSSLRNHLPDVPILALTATAVPKVQKDVIESLCLHDPLVLKSSFNRPNIYYEVRYKDLMGDAYADLSSVIISSGDVCAIIYCLERTTCDALSAHLSKNGISCAAYHAGLTNKLRSSVLDDWISSKIQVVVATVAFGMGIDRKDVRLVCHFNIPKSMEAFYQESGRAGRDQLPSRSLLYYGVDDRKRMELILRNTESKKLQSSSSQEELSKKSLSDFNLMVEYCESSGCRRRKILESFGEQVSASPCQKSCDACKHPNLVSQYLEELMATCAARQRNGFSQIIMTSSKDTIEDQMSEYWNRGDEASCSEEDISESDGSDDGFEAVKSLAKSNSRKLGLDEKLELLERAEENYYQSKRSKQICNTVSEALRETSKRRISNALSQAQQRLGNINIENETSSRVLETECYKKYGRNRIVYHSRVSGTVRWLSTASSVDLTNRLGISFPSSKDDASKEPPEIPTSPFANGPREITEPQVHGNTHSETTTNTRLESAHIGLSPGLDNSATETSPAQTASISTELPAIPSFSEFVNSKRLEGSNHSSTSKDVSFKRLKR